MVGIWASGEADPAGIASEAFGISGDAMRV